MSTLYVMVGLSGTGKSTAADIISQKTGASKHNSDIIRKEITSGSPTYSGDESQRVYDEMYKRAERDLKKGNDVVLDATFTLEIGRRSAEKLANRLDAELKLIHVTCSESVAKKRIRNRTNDESDATVEVYEKLKNDFEPLQRDHIKIDNSGSKRSLKRSISNKVL